MGFQRRLSGAELALRAAGGLLALAGVIAFFPVPAQAQQTQTEEMERRAKVLQTLPSNAAKQIFGSNPTPAPSKRVRSAPSRAAVWPAPRPFRSMARPGR